MFEVDKLQRLYLGSVGESNVTPLEIDISKWREEMPGCTIAVFAKRFHEDTLYVPAIATQNDVLTWTVSTADVAVAGDGLCEIRAYDAENGKLKKTRVIMTFVSESLHGDIDADAPSAMDEWQTRLAAAESSVNSAAVAARENAQQIIDMANQFVQVDRFSVEEDESGHVHFIGGQGANTEAYPVGSIYMSTIAINPQNLFGGVWEPVQDAVLLGAGRRMAGMTGGAERVMLSIDQIPQEEVTSDGN